MKYYNSYFDRQELSSAAHETLLHLEARKKASSPVWMPIGALAACTALIVAAGVWKLSPAPAPAPAQSGSQITLDNVPTAEDQPLQTDVSQPGDWETSFVVSNSGMKGKLAFPMIPGIEYPDQTESPDMALSRAYMPGAFTVDLAKEDIQTIFWGPEGKPQADHPKTEQGDLPWMLFWDGYTLQGRALYDGQGQLMELWLWGEQDRASFELELCPGALPFTCCIDANRGDIISEFNGVSVAGWSQVYDRDGDGQDDYICGSEFMSKNDIGVRFVSRNSLMRAEYEQDGNMDLGQVLADGGGNDNCGAVVCRSLFDDFIGKGRCDGARGRGAVGGNGRGGYGLRRGRIPAGGGAHLRAGFGLRRAGAGRRRAGFGVWSTGTGVRRIGTRLWRTGTGVRCAGAGLWRVRSRVRRVGAGIRRVGTGVRFVNVAGGWRDAVIMYRHLGQRRLGVADLLNGRPLRLASTKIDVGQAAIGKRGDAD